MQTPEFVSSTRRRPPVVRILATEGSRRSVPATRLPDMSAPNPKAFPLADAKLTGKQSG